MTTYTLARGLATATVDWTDPSTWSGDVVPAGPAADVVIDAGTAPSPVPAQVDASGVSIASLEVGQGETLFVQGPLDVSGQALVNGTVYLAAPMFTSPDIVVSPSGVLVVGGGFTIAAPARNDGTIETLPGDFTVTIAGDSSGSGTIVVGGQYSYFGQAGYMPLGSSLVLTGADRNNVRFDVAFGSLTLDRPAAFKGTIAGFAGPVDGVLTENGLAGSVTAPGNRIVLEGVNSGSITSESYAGNASGGVLTIREGGASIELGFAGNYGIGDFAFTAGQGGSSTVITDTVVTAAPCFAAGTLIATANGGMRVEEVVAGTRVLLHDGGTASVVWTGHRRVRGASPVRVRAGALDGVLPRRDLVLSSDHALLLDGVLVPAGLLVNGHTIVSEARDLVVYHHVELERHGVLLAEGAPAESYLDTGNRRQFANASIASAHEPFARGAETVRPCAEMVFGGAKLDAIRSRLEPGLAIKAA